MWPVAYAVSTAHNSRFANAIAALSNIVSRQGEGTGLTGEVCSTNSDCRGTRQCIDVRAGASQSNITLCPFADSNCICFAFVVCNSNADCEKGEVCNEVSNSRLCTSGKVPIVHAGTPTPSARPSDKKLNFERCSKSSECAGSRNCVVAENGELIQCSISDTCFCLTENFRCESTKDCDEGETCRGIGPSLLCAISSLPGVQLNFEKCLATGDCKGPRTCAELRDGKLELCRNANSCFCLTEKISCTSSGMCDEGETCQQIEDGNVCAARTLSLGPLVDEPTPCSEGGESLSIKDLFGGESPCRSRSTPTPASSIESPPKCTGENECSSEEECRIDSNGAPRCIRKKEVCISVHHLLHMNESEMTYSTHRLARVLCDEHNSCATAGHIVVYEAVPMMMSTYCNRVGCVQKIMHVNGVRYQRGRMVSSNSKGLMFSTFSARYNTGIEEKLLGVAIRIGL
ncbi:hypothetical protein BWQ96_09586 [Gracilariopsis chorda]|uniref:Uncharacterized protein n=1 Tax=Gracilariopsis chorda TaxID=448386 RepID=A0A2V3IFA6_9FLOR|nr:hypothetical protein BWQ96_09586 [Gracilariopsis chorda]|eukprot:PXF40708.1 hypothetical protein BWQ96_09586 [Gracilariopsis chorda]